MKLAGKDEEMQVLESAQVLTEYTGDDVYECNTCNEQFESSHLFENHVEKHHLSSSANNWIAVTSVDGKKIAVFQCSLCDVACRTASQRRAHEIQHFLKSSSIIDVNVKEEGEDFIFDDNELTEENVEEVVYADPKVSQSVKIEVASVSQLNSLGDYAVLEIDGVMCNECGTCSNDDILKCQLPEASNPVMCQQCTDVLPNPCMLKAHMRQVHPKKFKMTNAQPIKKYPCKLCELTFTSRNDLLDHKAQHSSMMLQCDICGAEYSGRSGLYVHKRRAHDKRRDFACRYCEKTFVLKMAREIHERVHTGERPYKCEMCNASFKAPSGLLVHRRTHTDERPFQCNVCGKRLRLAYNLKLHMRTHTGEKPYTCSICGRSFSQPSDCKKHMRVHSKMKTDVSPLDSD